MNLSSAGPFPFPSLRSSSGAPSFYRSRGSGYIGRWGPDKWAQRAVQHTVQSTLKPTVVMNLSSDMRTAAPLTQGGLLLSRQLGARWSSVACGVAC